jgi:hypothetical protein
MNANYLHHIFSPTILIGAIGTMAIFSLVFKENKLYRLFEHIFIGLAMGYSLATTWTQALRPKWWDLLAQGHWMWALIIPFGLMFYGVYTKKYAWMSRLIFGFYFGLAAGTVFQTFSAEYMPQLAHSFKPLFVSKAAHIDLFAAVNNWIFMAILIGVLTYFFFAFEQKHPVIKKTASFGRIMLMVAMGSIFGATIMTREALLIDRVRYLLIDWLQLDKLHF